MFAFTVAVFLQQAAPSYLDRAWEAYRKGNLQNATQLYQSAIGEAPLSVAAHYEYGLVLKDLRQFTDAEWQLRIAVELDPKFAPAQAELGSVYLAQDRIEEAEKALDTAVKLDKKDLVVRVRLGYVYGLKGDFKKAAKELEEVVKLESDYSLAWSDLARVRGELNDLKGSVEAAIKAVECGYADADVRAAAREIVEASGSDADKAYLAAIGQLADGKRAEAAAALAPLAPAEAPLVKQTFLALAEGKAESLQKAIEADRKAPKAGKLPRDLRSRIYEGLITTMLEAREFPKAQKTAEDAVKADPLRAENYYLLAAALGGQDKQEKKACDALTKAMDLGNRDALAARARTDPHFAGLKSSALFMMLTKPPKPATP